MTLLRHVERHDGGAPRFRSEQSDDPLPAEGAWQRAPRYSDLPMTWRTRLFGMGGVSTIASLIAIALLFTWTTFADAPAPQTLSVFDVAPEATAPEPPSEVPPGPEEVARKRPVPRPDTPPLVQLPGISPPAQQVPEETPDPGPLVERTTAPASKPVPPAPQRSDAKPTWQGAVLAALNKAKRYPREAGLRRQQGVPYIRFVMDREGRVLSSRLERSSGFSALDDEAVGLPRRAAPLPKPPEDVAGETIELVVPVEFFIRGQ